MTVAFDLQSPKDQEIKNVRDWGRHAKPSSDKQWKKGRSGMELARSWTGDHGLEALRLLLDEHTATAGFEVQRGIAGRQASFDSHRGSHKHDLLLVGQAAGGTTVVSIEAKVDEGFGQTLGEYRDAGRRKIARGDNTRALDRLQGLTKAVSGWEAGAAPRRLELRYGLFAAIAGTTAAAVDEGADQAVLCVHEFVTKALTPEKQKRNDDDLRNFIHVVFDELVVGDDPSWIVGPLKLHGGSERMPASMPFFIAKLSTPPAGG